jgi:hypothetical protein
MIVRLQHRIVTDDAIAFQPAQQPGIGEIVQDAVYTVEGKIGKVSPRLGPDGFHRGMRLVVIKVAEDNPPLGGASTIF